MDEQSESSPNQRNIRKTLRGSMRPSVVEGTKRKARKRRHDKGNPEVLEEARTRRETEHGVEHGGG